MADKPRGDSVTVTFIAQCTLIVLGVLITTAFLFIIRDALLIAFAGVIFAVILNGFASIIRNYIPISRSWSIATFGLIIIIGIYFVIDPGTYKKGIGLLFTKKRTDRMTEAMETAVIAMVLVGMFYIEDVLGKKVSIPGRAEG